MLNKELILIGGGGHCKSVIEAAESAGYEIIGILDKPENVGQKVLGYSVIGTDADIVFYVAKARFVITVGQIESACQRIALHKKVMDAGGELAVIVASTAFISRHSTLCEGTVVLHHAVINAGAKIGVGCIINTAVVIEHDVIVGNYSHISTGAIINGGCNIGNAVFVGSQSVLKQGTTLGNNVVVGAASFVKENIYTEGVYAGNPTRKIK